jgi:uncharacterized repeat protein (TIGR03803 family)
MNPQAVVRVLIGISWGCVLVPSWATAQTPTFQINTLHSFLAPPPSSPQAVLVQASDGNFYGTTFDGGPTDNGTAFRLTPSGVLTVLHMFVSGGGAPITPIGSLIQASDGNFYGAAYNGGSVNLGAILRMASDGTVTVLHSFAGGSSDGTRCQGGVIQASDGNFYGTTVSGGASGGGTIFRITPSGTASVLHSFTTSSEGGFSTSAVVQGSDGNLYGTTRSGGPAGGGTAFRITTGGVFTVLHAFASSTEGANPGGALVQGSDGNFYGTLVNGGSGSNGTVFRMTPSGSVTVLHAFTGSDGSGPSAGLTLGSDGNFYGTTTFGGASNVGAAFRITPSGTYTLLHSFTGADGAEPEYALVQSSSGTLFGTTVVGGANDAGSAFELTLGGTLTVRYSFGGSADGALPRGLITANDGNLYGTTRAGGKADFGTVFRMTAAGVATPLHDLTHIEGADAGSAVMLAHDGNFYGAVGAGGAFGLGALYRVAPDGTFTTLHTFSYSDGAFPNSPPIEASDGNFYGTTESGGSSGVGTIYQMTPGGVLSVLHSFSASTDGWSPYAPLIQASDGNLYGTTPSGGPSGKGTAFRITTGGTFAVLHAFAGGSDGAVPYFSSLLEAQDGNFYGTTQQGGASNKGTVFRMTPAGAVTILHAFAGGADGATPDEPLIQAADGTLYGTTAAGGPANAGTVFRMTPDGTLTVIYAFSGGADGNGSFAPLVQGPDGSLYGTTFYGGAFGSGTAFQINAVTVTSPNGGEKLYAGTPYTITWTAFGRGGVNRIDVAYSKDGGTFWTPISECTALSGSATSCAWSAPSPSSAKGKIRVTMTDAEGDILADFSDRVFTVASTAASVTVKAPNTAINWGIGSHQQITWSHNLGASATFSIALSRDGGATFPETIAASVPAATAGSGTFDWIVTGPATTAARVKITAVHEPSATDTSNVNFSIAPVTLTVTAPKTHANWGIGTLQLQKWTTNLGVGDTVDVQLSVDGGTTWTPLATGVAASLKSATVTTPNTPTTTARLRVVWTNPPAGFSATGENPGVFTIAAPFITLTSPNGANSWTDGSSQTIKWTNNLGAIEFVKIELSQDGGGTYPITVLASTPSDGTRAVTVSSAWNTTTAKIRVTWLKDAGVQDASNANFTIHP